MLSVAGEKRREGGEFGELAEEEQIERTVQALKANGIDALVAENAEEARRMFFERVPDGAEIFLGASVTLETLGIKDEIDKSGRYNALRPKMSAMDRATQGREIRKLGGAPDYAAGSVHA
ncbi:MAG TPA: LUD domain-containing protein, partial [Nitrospirota bacterium]